MNSYVRLILIITTWFYVHTSIGIPNNEKEGGRGSGGQNAVPHSHPYIISLQTKLLSFQIHFCGGALLNEYFVLSAAHCATESWLISWFPLDAIAGIHNVRQTSVQTAQIRRITDRIPHPLFKGGIGVYDIGLFKTITPFRFTKAVQPIKLSTGYNHKTNTETLKLVGWGALRIKIFKPDPPTDLQEINVAYIPFKECYDALEKTKEIDEVNPLDEDSNLCTDSGVSKVGACPGDSGGPLVQMHENFSLLNDPVGNTKTCSCNCTQCKEHNDIHGKAHHGHGIRHGKQVNKLEPLLLGIVSWGVLPCGKLGAPTVYTNVTTFTDFIHYHTQNFNSRS